MNSGAIHRQVAAERLARVSQEARDQCEHAWREAYWASIPHTQYYRKREACLKWFWHLIPVTPKGIA